MRRLLDTEHSKLARRIQSAPINGAVNFEETSTFDLDCTMRIPGTHEPKRLRRKEPAPGLSAVWFHPGRFRNNYWA